MELLAPAGSIETLVAAIDAGADAVYFGLSELNARRGAANIAHGELADAVRLAHQKGTKAYLAINTDIAQREIRLCAKYLELAAENSVDAVIVKDPAIFKMIPFFPSLQFHLSTQAGISSSMGVAAVRDFGFKRVVLPRELSLEEIRSASSVPGIETEIFIQGALCFSVSGRCLLSSWLGGRSGNRGLCASPCRFNWRASASDERLFSMRDLCLIEKIPEIIRSGAASLKIEGRLKNAEWVAKTVAFYRDALDGKDKSQNLDALAELASYAGRSLTQGYFENKLDELTGDSARPGSCSQEALLPPDSRPTSIEISVEKIKDAFHCAFKCGSFSDQIQISAGKSDERRLKDFTDIAEGLRLKKFQGYPPVELTSPSPDLKLPSGAVKQILEGLGKFMHSISKKSTGHPKIKIRPELQEMIEAHSHGYSADNLKSVSDAPNLIRFKDWDKFCEFRKNSRECTALIENPSLENLSSPANDDSTKCAVAFPPVIYESSVDNLSEIARICAQNGIQIEANSWDGWKIAKVSGAEILGGIGLMVLNSMAAAFLVEKGCLHATASIEADDEKLRDLCAASSVPIALYVFGRPLLMISRAKLPHNSGKCDEHFEILDRSGESFHVSKESDLTCVRPAKYFSFDGAGLNDIRVAVICADAPPQGQAQTKDPRNSLPEQMKRKFANAELK